MGITIISLLRGDGGLLREHYINTVPPRHVWNLRCTTAEQRTPLTNVFQYRERSIGNTSLVLEGLKLIAVCSLTSFSNLMKIQE